jgi:catechol 2,3-dioxygenase-like lactoylglutathione lyase family enzyme
MYAPLTIEGIDHLVLTVRDIEVTCDFYETVLGMTAVTFAGRRKALTFGGQKINLHPAGREFEPKAAKPMPGSADLCLITRTAIAQVIIHLQSRGVEIEDGPVQRDGATGPITSVYFRDPDGNFIEVCNYN